MSEEIIDGVNVSECFYFIDHTPPKGQGDWGGAIHKGACKVYSKDCEYNKDCYFKQLQRLQAENKRLKDAIKSINKPVFLPNIEQEATNKYRKALEEIREYLQQFKKKKSNFYTLNDVVTDIANNIEKIINEVLK